jgi:hypothetical protein
MVSSIEFEAAPLEKVRRSVTIDTIVHETVQDDELVVVGSTVVEDPNYAMKLEVYLRT